MTGKAGTIIFATSLYLYWVQSTRQKFYSLNNQEYNKALWVRGKTATSGFLGKRKRSEENTSFKIPFSKC